MDNLNFNDGKWWQFTVNFRLPHHGFSIGYDIYQPAKDSPAVEIYLYLGFLTLGLMWGDENWVFDEETEE
jgi:hypothetical protein